MTPSRVPPEPEAQAAGPNQSGHPGHTWGKGPKGPIPPVLLTREERKHGAPRVWPTTLHCTVCGEDWPGTGPCVIRGETSRQWDATTQQGGRP